MQEFLSTEKVDCNLMSLTGYRVLVLFERLLDNPQSLDEINDYFIKNKYIDSAYSKDTLRIYLNSLRAAGCDISRTNKSTDNKYILKSHPFEYPISIELVRIFEKIYLYIYSKLDIDELLMLEDFFGKLANYAKDQSIKERLVNISKLKNVNKSLLRGLLLACDNKNKLKIVYKSPKFGEVETEINAEKVAFKNNKVYLFGYTPFYKNESYLPISRISEILEVMSSDGAAAVESTVVEYLLDGRKITETSKNKFALMQKILSFGDECKVLAGDEFKKELLEKIKQTRAQYD